MSIKKQKITFWRKNTGLSLLDCYIIAEINLIFWFSVSILASLAIALGSFSDLGYKVFEFNLPIDLALKALLWKIPEFLAYALPIGLLLATLITYGRFSKDSEIIAWRSCGIGVYRLVIPALIFSFAITVITFIFTESVVPKANYQATEIIAQVIPEERKFTQEKHIIYPEYQVNNHGQIKFLFYAQEFDETAMQDLTILVWDEQDLTEIILAKRGIWDSQKDVWRLFQGSIYRLNEKSRPLMSLDFDSHELQLASIPWQLAIASRDPYQMNIMESWEYLAIISQSGDQKKLMMFQVRTQQKMAFPFICLVFGLIGSTLGISSTYLSRAQSLGISVIIVFFYYLFGFLTGALGLVGIFSPVIAAWLPNILGIGIGGWLLACKAR